MKFDLELSAINVTGKYFDCVQVDGCNFHFSQCLYRKVQALGVVSLYQPKTQEKIELRTHVRKVTALVHIPVAEIGDAWLDVIEQAPESSVHFNDYVCRAAASE
ncbi:hypothetical protein QYM36_003799 [Artemia franciscana]|uniref:Uncharacterized protein n=1 Tax=Artemia franciscana TaxID=6661 RepID=A0AA88L937_ARTSF|nr:hypothetical protein QYM36_003799 [Artemia franciscana]